MNFFLAFTSSYFVHAKKIFEICYHFNLLRQLLTFIATKASKISFQENFKKYDPPHGMLLDIILDQIELRSDWASHFSNPELFNG